MCSNDVWLTVPLACACMTIKECRCGCIDSIDHTNNYKLEIPMFLNVRHMTDERNNVE